MAALSTTAALQHNDLAQISKKRKHGDSTILPLDDCDVCTNKADLDKLQLPTDVVQLNVGGTRFTTTKTTLRHEQHWVLGSLAQWNVDGEMFFDANPVVFTWILQRLRSQIALPWRHSTIPAEFVHQQLSFWCLGWWDARTKLLPRKRVVNQRALEMAIVNTTDEEDLAAFFIAGHTCSFASDYGISKRLVFEAENQIHQCRAPVVLPDCTLPNKNEGGWSILDGDVTGYFNLPMWWEECTIAMAIDQLMLDVRIPETEDLWDKKSMFECMRNFNYDSIDALLLDPIATEMIDTSPVVATIAILRNTFESAKKIHRALYDQALTMWQNTKADDDRREVIKELNHVLHPRGLCLQENICKRNADVSRYDVETIRMFHVSLSPTWVNPLKGLPEALGVSLRSNANYSYEFVYNVPTSNSQYTERSYKAVPLTGITPIS
jgi:hypothetical protein